MMGALDKLTAPRQLVQSCYIDELVSKSADIYHKDIKVFGYTWQ